MTRTFVILTLAILTLAACGEGNTDGSSAGNQSKAVARHPAMTETLHAAILKDDVDVVRGYLALGGDPNAVFSETGAACLHIAAMVPGSRCLGLRNFEITLGGQ